MRSPTAARSRDIATPGVLGTILSLIGVSALTVFLITVRNALSSAAQAFGQEWARLLIERRRHSRGFRRLPFRPRGRVALMHLLAASAPLASRATARTAQDALGARIVPTPGAAALIHTVQDPSSPFANRCAAVIGIGPGMGRELEDLLRVTGRRSVFSRAFAIDPLRAGSAGDRVLTSAGDLWTQLDAALEWGRQTVDAAENGFLAVLLRTPVTGDWALDARFDFPRLVRTLLRSRGYPVWLTMAEPTDPSAWPDEVVMSLPVPARGFQRALRRTRYRPAVAPVRAGRRALRLTSSDAAGLLVALSDPLGSLHPRDASAAAPRRYSAEVTLAIREVAGGDAHVEIDDGINRGLQDLLDAAEVRFLAAHPDGDDLLLPMTVCPQRLVAWRASRPAGEPAVVLPGALMTTPPVRWLSEACESRDEAVAAAILADHGRAWIESSDLDAALPLLRRTEHTFDRASRAGLWARYLLALDAALRLNRPAATWFDEESCSLAESTELGLLFRAERVEFSRLRGDLDAACAGLNALTDRLSSPVAATSSSSEAYAQGTARYVAANTLRRGGRYDRARELVDTAVAAYDASVPAHRVEITHGTYAISVCDSLRGVAAVRSTNWAVGEAVFASSLVTLANSHASWFVQDYHRAVDFARQAQQGFDGIGYQRYAERARDLARLIAEWARRSGRPVTTTSSELDERVRELLAVPRNGHTELLARERPSRALSLLSFATAFDTEPDAPRTIALPRYIAITPEDGYLLRTPPPAGSFRQAEHALRTVIGVGADTRLPLAVD